MERSSYHGRALTLAGAGLDALASAPLLKSGMVLRLRAESGRHQHLWLAADSMEEAEWRELRRILLQQPISG